MCLQEVLERQASEVSGDLGNAPSERGILPPDIGTTRIVSEEMEEMEASSENGDINMANSMPSFHWRPPQEIGPNEDETLLQDLSRHSAGFSDYESFLWYRSIISSWSRCWGGMADWPRNLEVELDRARGNGPEALARFFRRMWNHEQRGRFLLHSIQKQTASSLPANPEAIMTLWNLQQDQVIVLTRGLTIIELTALVAERSMFSIGGDSFIEDFQAAHVSANTGLYRASRHNNIANVREQEENGREEEEVTLLCTVDDE